MEVGFVVAGVEGTEGVILNEVGGPVGEQNEYFQKQEHCHGRKIKHDQISPGKPNPKNFN